MGASSYLDQAGDDEARGALARCCGSSRWIERMMARRPFGSDDDLVRIAREEWFALGPGDWREAFAHHPRIGDTAGLRARFPQTHAQSAREQSGVRGAGDEVLEALAAANREYEQRFGYIFIVCATGKTAAEMLGLLRQRLGNTPADEILIAAGEQARITELRLRALAS